MKSRLKRFKLWRWEKVIFFSPQESRLEATQSHSSYHILEENEKFVPGFFLFNNKNEWKRWKKLFVDHEKVFPGVFDTLVLRDPSPPFSELLNIAWTRWGKQTYEHMKSTEKGRWSFRCRFFYYFCKLLHWSSVTNNTFWRWINANLIKKSQFPGKILFNRRISAKKSREASELFRNHAAIKHLIWLLFLLSRIRKTMNFEQRMNVNESLMMRNGKVGGDLLGDFCGNLLSFEDNWWKIRMNCLGFVWLESTFDTLYIIMIKKSYEI